METIAAELDAARKMGTMCALNIPVGIISIISAFVFDSSPFLMAVLIILGIATDLSAFYGLKISSMNVDRLVEEYSKSKKVRAYMMTTPMKSGLLKTVGSWAERNSMIIKMNVTSDEASEKYYHWSFENDNDLILFKMTFG